MSDLRTGAEVATDAAAVFITLDEVDSSGVRRKVEYRAGPLGVKDYMELQTWLKRRVIDEAQRTIRECNITDPSAVRMMLERAYDESRQINLLLFDNEATIRAFNDFETFARFIYYALKREHPEITLEKAVEIVDAAPDAEGLVKTIQEASQPQLTAEQKKSSPPTEKAELSDAIQKTS